MKKILLLLVVLTLVFSVFALPSSAHLTSNSADYYYAHYPLDALIVKYLDNHYEERSYNKMTLNEFNIQPETLIETGFIPYEAYFLDDIIAEDYYNMYYARASGYKDSIYYSTSYVPHQNMSRSTFYIFSGIVEPDFNYEFTASGEYIYYTTDNKYIVVPLTEVVDSLILTSFGKNYYPNYSIGQFIQGHNYNTDTYCYAFYGLEYYCDAYISEKYGLGNDAFTPKIKKGYSLQNAYLNIEFDKPYFYAVDKINCYPYDIATGYSVNDNDIVRGVVEGSFALYDEFENTSLFEKIQSELTEALDQPFVLGLSVVDWLYLIFGLTCFGYLMKLFMGG